MRNVSNSVPTSLDDAWCALNADSSSTADYIIQLLSFAGSEHQSLNAVALGSPAGEPDRIIAAGLVRLMHAGFDNFAPLESIAAYKILDRTFSQSLYRSSKITSNTQSHEKRRALIDLFDQALRAYEIAVPDILNVESTRIFKQRLMRALNAERSKILILPLLPTALRSDLAFADLFTAIDSFLQAKMQDRRSAADLATLRLEEIVSRGKASRSSFFDQLFSSLLDTLRTRLTVAIEADPAVSPVSLEIVFADQKYPLKQIGATYKIMATLNVVGRGYADAVRITYAVEDAQEDDLFLGCLPSGTCTLSLPARVAVATDQTRVSCIVQWTDVDGPHDIAADVQVGSQLENVDWERLARSDPYSTDAVESESQFVGRSEQLSILRSRLGEPAIPSFYVVGQKRVGKTSLIRTLLSTLHKESSSNDIASIFLEGGDFIAGDAAATVRRLCHEIVRKLVSVAPKFKPELAPDFGTAMSDLTLVFEGLWKLYPALRLLIVLDEFNELPLELFQRGPLSRALFVSLRSLSAKPRLGFAIIGSETLDMIVSEQGEHLNKWDRLALDYFDKKEHWNDYLALIRRPTEGQIEFADAAVEALYEATSGHPFFTKLICRDIVRNAVAVKASFVSDGDVRAAVVKCAETEASIRFQHFWNDALFVSLPEQEIISLRRRKIFLACGDLMRRGKELSLEAICTHELLISYGKQLIEDLQSFQQRGIVYRSGEQAYRFKVPLFAEWLKAAGSREIVAEIPDPGDVEKKLKQREVLRIPSGEILELASKWTYRWRTVQADAVRAWLEQFGNLEDQRIMFGLLKRLAFYSGDGNRAKLRDYFRRLVGRYGTSRLPRQQKLQDFLVTYVDGVGKSGASFAKAFIDENKIAASSLIERASIKREIEKDRGVRAIIVLDDVAGTGRSLKKGLTNLWEECGAEIADRKIPLHVGVMAANAIALDAVRVEIEKRYERFELSSFDLLTETDKVFAPSSRFFGSTEDRLRAREMCYEFGRELFPEGPLGFGGCELAVVFDQNCPNNSLPVLWSSKNDWRPLFERV